MGTDQIADVYLRKEPVRGHVLSVLGRSGEAVPGVHLRVQAYTTILSSAVQLDLLKTDGRGEACLGHLPNTIDLLVNSETASIRVPSRTFHLGDLDGHRYLRMQRTAAAGAPL